MKILITTFIKDFKKIHYVFNMSFNDRLFISKNNFQKKKKKFETDFKIQNNSRYFNNKKS